MTTPAGELLVSPPVTVAGQVRVSARLRSPGRADLELWYSMDASLADAVTDRADPFVLAALMRAMADGVDLEVRGAPVSSSLLRNLEELVAAWHGWRGFSPIGLVAERETEEVSRRARPAVAGFSGGVDSAFTVQRHVSGAAGRRRRALGAAVMVHGFDIPLDDPVGFDRASARARRMLDTVGVPLLTMATNVRAAFHDWEDAHGLALGSALTLLGSRFGSGLIAGSAPYQALVLPWGSNAVTDWMMGSRSFEIVHDGADATRVEKIRSLATWPGALEHLRVCWIGAERDRNCGGCPKCVHTLLAFRCLGVEPRCFDTAPTDDQITACLRSCPGDPFARQIVAELWSIAQERQLRAPWLRRLERAARESSHALSRHALARRLGASIGRLVAPVTRG